MKNEERRQIWIDACEWLNDHMDDWGCWAQYRFDVRIEAMRRFPDGEQIGDVSCTPEQVSQMPGGGDDQESVEEIE